MQVKNYIIVLLISLIFHCFSLEINSKLTKTNSIVNVKKGFGNNKSTTPSSLKTTDQLEKQNNLENVIQSNIDKYIGLREAMVLCKDLIKSKSLETYHNNEDIDYLIKLNTIKHQEDRLNELEISNGWNQTSIHNKIQEITWDASANERMERHENEKISDSMNEFMIFIAKKCLQSQLGGYILDVGCGTGLIYSYMNKINKERNNKSRKSNFNEEKCIGVDLSSNMIKYAKKTFPSGTFYQCDFLDFQYNHKFNVIIFNECLHYFNNYKDTIKHAISLSNCKEHSGMIIISHPKGYAHVQKLFDHNNFIVRNILPNKIELNNIIQSIMNEYKEMYNQNLKILIEQIPDEKSKHYLAILKFSF